MSLPPCAVYETIIHIDNSKRETHGELSVAKMGSNLQKSFDNGTRMSIIQANGETIKDRELKVSGLAGLLPKSDKTEQRIGIIRGNKFRYKGATV